MMNFTEKTVSQEEKYHGILVNIRLDQIELPNGKPALREVCEHCGGVGVLPIDGEGNVILVRQHRYAYHLDILEIPAGKMDHGSEDHRACGIRELKEETGCTAAEIYYLGEMYPSPGFLEEIAYDGLCLPLGLCLSAAGNALNLLANRRDKHGKEAGQ